MEFIVIFLVFIFASAALAIIFLARIAMLLSCIAIGIAGVALLAIGYVSVAVAGMAFAVLIEILGNGHAGFALAAALFAGLLAAFRLVRSVVSELLSLPARIKIKLGFLNEAGRSFSSVQVLHNLNSLNKCELHHKAPEEDCGRVRQN